MQNSLRRAAAVLAVAIGQFDNPHSLALDSQGRIFVGDRTNDRIQIFSPTGQFIAEWRQFGRPSSVPIQNDILYVADSESRNIPGQYGYNPGYHRGIYIGRVKDGVVTAFTPDPRPNGAASFPEGISLTKDGVICLNRRSQCNEIRFTLGAIAPGTHGGFRCC